MDPWPWLGEPEQRVHVRNDIDYELLLAIEGHARGGTFILFAGHGAGWVQISEGIEQAHHPVRVRHAGNDGWRDFQTFVPLWGSGQQEVLVSTYSWNGRKYGLKTAVTARWCDHEPFRADPELCPSR
jgi:hypothetical protein